jgi:molecular chaperone DnaK
MLAELAEVPQVPANSPPSVLLAARYEVVDFIGRDDERRRLSEWLEGDEVRSVRLVTGPGGQGKTRLALKAARGATGWQVLVAHHDRDGAQIALAAEARVAREGGHVLLIVDYADRWPTDDLINLFAQQELRATRADDRIRLLLLARSTKSWAASLTSKLRSRDIAALELSLGAVDLGTDGGEHQLPSRQDVFWAAAGRFARHLGVEESLISEPPLEGKAFELMLSVQMAALVSVLTVPDQLSDSRRKQLAGDPAAASRYLILRETEHWQGLKQRADPLRLSETVMAEAVFVATLTRGLDHDEAVAVLDALALGEPSPRIIQDHQLCYPPIQAGHVLEPLYPDLLGEDFLAAVLPGAPPDHTMEYSLASLADDGAPGILRRLLSLPGTGRLVPGPGPAVTWPNPLVGPVMTELIEVSRRWEHVARRYALPAISANPFLILAAGSATLGRLREVPGADTVLPAVHAALDRVIGVGVNLDLDAGAVLITERIAELARSRGDKAGLAHSLRTLSIRQMAVGEDEAALDSAKKAADLGWDTGEPGSQEWAAGLPERAAGLTNLATVLDRQEQYDKAVDPARQAVHLYQLLAGQENRNPAADLPGLCTALANLGKVLSGLGSYQEALKHAQAAVYLYRQISDSLDEGRQITLPSVLTNLVRLLSDLGRPSEALAPAREAVALYQRLADPDTGNPKAGSPALAISLNNLGGLLSDLGMYQDAVVPAKEAEALYRQIADPETGNPAYLPDLATALANVSKCLSNLGGHAEALSTAQEAVSLARQVADTGTRSSAVSVPALAAALLNLSSCLSQVGDNQPSLAASGEAIKLYRQVAASNSVAFNGYLPDFAIALSSQATSLARVGSTAEALALLQEAIPIAGRLANPDTGERTAALPGLAASLHNAAAVLSDQGQPPGALRMAEEAAEQAVVIYQRLTEVDAAGPVAYLSGLAASLRIVSDVRFGGARLEEALEPAEEAVRIYQDLSGSGSDETSPFSAVCASACHHLGVLLWELDRQAEAIGPIQEAARIRRRMADPRAGLPISSSATLLTPLAAALHNLGTILSEQDRQREALQWVEEAAEIRRQLASLPSDDLPARQRDLAASLHNLATILSSLGKPERALGSADEAVSIYRMLAEEVNGSRSAYLPDLADALRNLSDRLSEMKPPADALPAIREATSIYRTLVDDPEGTGSAYLPSLAASLTAQALMSQHDNPGAAADAMSEAAEYWTVLAEQAPEQYASAFASVLEALARLRERVDGGQEGTDAQQETEQPAEWAVTSPVGIDLGTTNSVVAVLEGGKPRVVASAEGLLTTPSVVAFTKDDQVLVGETAKRQAVTNVDRTIRSVKRHMGTSWSVLIDGRKFIPQQISAFILQKLKRDAEAYLDATIADVVISVPAYFNDAQRQATKEAGQIAGLNVLRIINEPTAAALAYHLHRTSNATILVFDLGGGTFDVSLLEVGEGVIDVNATSGDNHLGGDDWDQRIIDWLIGDFKASYGIDLSKDKTALQRLREVAERAKTELSSSIETRINLPFITVSDQGELHLDTRLTRAEFQQMTADLLDRCKAPVRQVITDAKVEMSDIDHVILVGGSTRMPAVVDLVKSLTGGKEPNKGVNPDEVVAIGACLLAGILKREVRDIALLDITPLSLGIEPANKVLAKLIERNTTIPVKKSDIFTTADDNQPSVCIQVYQGEREIAAYNKKLGMFDLGGIALAPRGVPQIEVTFEIDVNGILNVSALDLATRAQQKVNISGGYTLAPHQIEQMKAEVERYADEELRRREETEARDRDKFLNRNAEEPSSHDIVEMPDDITAEVTSAVANLKKALDGTDAGAEHTATQKFARASQKLGTAMFTQTQRRTGGERKAIAARASRNNVEVWPQSFSQWTGNPEGLVHQSFQVICRTCGDRWDRDLGSLPAGLQRLRGPYDSAQEAEHARTAHIKDCHISENLDSSSKEIAIT